MFRMRLRAVSNFKMVERLARATITGVPGVTDVQRETSAEECLILRIRVDPAIRDRRALIIEIRRRLDVAPETAAKWHIDKEALFGIAPSLDLHPSGNATLSCYWPLNRSNIGGLPIAKKSQMPIITPPQKTWLGFFEPHSAG